MIYQASRRYGVTPSNSEWSGFAYALMGIHEAVWHGLPLRHPKACCQPCDTCLRHPKACCQPCDTCPKTSDFTWWPPCTELPVFSEIQMDVPLSLLKCFLFLFVLPPIHVARRCASFHAKPMETPIGVVLQMLLGFKSLLSCKATRGELL